MNKCQSCGLVMENENLKGNNKDSSKSQDYCKYCYPDGSFNKEDETFEEMIETCIPFVMKKGCSEEEARDLLIKDLSKLKRWSNSN